MEIALRYRRDAGRASRQQKIANRAQQKIPARRSRNQMREGEVPPEPILTETELKWARVEPRPPGRDHGPTVARVTRARAPNIPGNRCSQLSTWVSRGSQPAG